MGSIPADVLLHLAEFTPMGTDGPRLAAVCSAWRNALRHHYAVYRVPPAQSDTSCLGDVIPHMLRYAPRVKHLTLVTTHGVVEVAMLAALAWSIDAAVWSTSPLQYLHIGIYGPRPGVEGTLWRVSETEPSLTD